MAFDVCISFILSFFKNGFRFFVRVLGNISGTVELESLWLFLCPFVQSLRIAWQPSTHMLLLFIAARDSVTNNKPVGAVACAGTCFCRNIKRIKVKPSVKNSCSHCLNLKLFLIIFDAFSHFSPS